MPKIQRNRNTFWLFPDNLGPAGSTFEIVEYKEEYETRTGKKIPVFVLLGSDKDRQGEFLLTSWNIANLNDLIDELGEDSEKWQTKLITLIPVDVTDKKNGKFTAKLEEQVT